MKDFEWNVFEVLYDFDGPQIFTIKNEQGFFLAYRCDEDLANYIDRFIVVPTDEVEIEELKVCHKDMFSVLAKDELWLVDSCYLLDKYPKLFSPKMSSKESTVSDYIPLPGVFLYSK